MRIAIVDDNADDRRWLARQIAELLERRELEGSVSRFASGEEFLAAARQTRFELAFLDIYMDGLDGVAAARELRSFDPDCVLVFSTSSRDHALEGFQVRAAQYLVKPYQAEELERLEQLFDGLTRLLPAPEKYVELRSERRDVRVRLGDILWADHFQHQMHIHTIKGREISTRLTFREFSTQLASDPRFFVCGRGLLVNLDHAADFDGTVFLLSDGTRLPVTRDLAPAARTAFADRLFRLERGKGS